MAVGILSQCCTNGFCETDLWDAYSSFPTFRLQWQSQRPFFHPLVSGIQLFTLNLIPNYIPYAFTIKQVDSDLINLLEVTKIIFSEHPPVVWAGGFSDDIDDLPRILNLIKISAHLERAYDEMGLDKSATDEQIRSRFRQLVHIYHPDRGGSNEQFIRLQYCFASLLEARRRDFN